MKGLGTRDALLCTSTVLFQRYREMNWHIFACFIDYQKEFDRKKHDQMIDVLMKTGIIDTDLKIIRNLYWNQSAIIKINMEEQTKTVNILRGLRQGCILSPLIFILYSEYIFKEAFDNTDIGILMNGEQINNILYANDTVVFPEKLNHKN